MLCRELFEQIEFPKLEPTQKNIELAKEFVLRKWQERHLERYPDLPEHLPTDLSGSCKASSMFAQRLFGGTIKGNYDHQFLVLDNGNILDLNIDAKDVKSLKNPHRHDRKFFGNRDHKESMKSLEPRVNRWVDEFFKEYSK